MKQTKYLWWILVPLLMASAFVAGRLTPAPEARVVPETDSPTLPPTSRPATSAVPLAGGFGIIGDSSSDEYRADDNRGADMTTPPLNWMELLVAKRAIDFGAWGAWGEPRRSGYEYNWARSAATTDTMIQTGQHLGLAKQVAAGQVSHVVVWIGQNEFASWNGTYDDVYYGRLNNQALQAKIDRIIANITTAVDTILAAGPVQMVLVTIPDRSLSPEVIQAFPDPVRRGRVTAAVNAVNDGIGALAAAHGLPIVRADGIAVELSHRVAQDGGLWVGGELIKVLAKGNDPHFGRLDDSDGHPGTVMSGLVANWVFVEPFDSYYGLGVQPLTDAEILAAAGLAATPAP